MEKICRENNEMFVQCFEEVKEGLVNREGQAKSFWCFPRHVLVLGPRAAKNPGEAA